MNKKLNKDIMLKLIEKNKDYIENYGIYDHVYFIDLKPPYISSNGNVHLTFNDFQNVSIVNYDLATVKKISIEKYNKILKYKNLIKQLIDED